MHGPACAFKAMAAARLKDDEISRKEQAEVWYNLVHHQTMFHKSVPGTSNFSAKHGKLASPV